VDSFLALALVVSEEMYSTSIPLVALGSEVFAELPSEGEVTLKPDGRIIVYPF
jgi:hypothetical protein